MRGDMALESLPGRDTARETSKCIAYPDSGSTDRIVRYTSGSPRGNHARCTHACTCCTRGGRRTPKCSWAGGSPAATTADWIRVISLPPRRSAMLRRVARRGAQLAAAGTLVSSAAVGGLAAYDQGFRRQLAFWATVLPGVCQYRYTSWKCKDIDAESRSQEFAKKGRCGLFGFHTGT